MSRPRKAGLKSEPHRRRDSWDQEEYTEAEVQARWVALEQMEIEDGSGLRAIQTGEAGGGDRGPMGPRLT